MLGDQAVPEAEVRVDVVDDLAAGLREGVGRDPVRGARLLARVVLGEFDHQVVGALGEHLPHGAGFAAGEAGEDRIRELRVGRVGRGHGRAVAGAEGGIEALDQLLEFGGGHGASLSLLTWRVTAAKIAW